MGHERLEGGNRAVRQGREGNRLDIVGQNRNSGFEGGKWSTAEVDRDTGLTLVKI